MFHLPSEAAIVNYVAGGAIGKMLHKTYVSDSGQLLRHVTEPQFCELAKKGAFGPMVAQFCGTTITDAQKVAFWVSMAIGGILLIWLLGLCIIKFMIEAEGFVEDAARLGSKSARMAPENVEAVLEGYANRIFTAGQRDGSSAGRIILDCVKDPEKLKALKRAIGADAEIAPAAWWSRSISGGEFRCPKANGQFITRFAEAVRAVSKVADDTVVAAESFSEADAQRFFAILDYVDAVTNAQNDGRKFHGKAYAFRALCDERREETSFSVDELFSSLVSTDDVNRAYNFWLQKKDTEGGRAVGDLIQKHYCGSDECRELSKDDIVAILKCEVLCLHSSFYISLGDQLGCFRLSAREPRGPIEPFGDGTCCVDEYFFRRLCSLDCPNFEGGSTLCLCLAKAPNEMARNYERDVISADGERIDIDALNGIIEIINSLRASAGQMCKRLLSGDLDGLPSRAASFYRRAVGEATVKGGECDKWQLKQTRKAAKTLDAVMRSIR
ncbi:MAG: hypothetical protein LBI39_04405 [Puniceicoccales bacterium]|jgi:hypothetical protein|nr:hypothetical protein [Puniceicoccales bacterium]